MNSKKEIRIPLSKFKLILLILGSIAFVATSAFILLNPNADLGRRYPPFVLKIVSIIGVLFFGATGIIGIRKLFQNTPGLILNEKGISDESSGVSIGLIKKEDIIAVRKHQVMSTKFLLIDVKNPEAYIELGKNAATKKLLKMNFNQYGTPISINSNALKIKFDELEKLIHDYIQEKGQQV